MTLQAFRMTLQTFRVMLQAFRMTLQAFRVMLRPFRMTLQAFRVSLQTFRMTLQVLRVVLLSFRDGAQRRDGTKCLFAAAHAVGKIEKNQGRSSLTRDDSSMHQARRF